DVPVDETRNEAFYEREIPAEAYELADQAAWRKPAEQDEPKLLRLPHEQVARPDPARATDARDPTPMQGARRRSILPQLHQPTEASGWRRGCWKRRSRR